MKAVVICIATVFVLSACGDDGRRAGVGLVDTGDALTLSDVDTAEPADTRSDTRADTRAEVEADSDPEDVEADSDLEDVAADSTPDTIDDALEDTTLPETLDDVSADTLADSAPETIEDTTLPETLVDSTPEAIEDTTLPETLADTLVDTTPEVIEDTSLPETLVDTTPELTEDTTPDTLPETLADTTPETFPEVIEDTTPETSPEVIEDTTPETFPEVIEDTTPETFPEVIEDTTLETSPEVIEDTTPETIEPLPPADLNQLSAPPYLMWVTQTEVSVRWETKQPLIGRVDFGPTDSLGRTLVEPAAVTTHELRLTGLTPDTQHSYRIVYGGGALDIRHFRTAPPDDSSAPFQFIVWGDNQDGPDVFNDLVGIMAEHDPRFAVSVGDCVQNGTRGEYRNQLFSPMSGFADEVPYLVAAGNHERYSDPNASLFNEYFSQPGNEHCFGWRYGGLFILFLDTDLGLDGANGQRACIEAALSSEAATTAKVRAAAFHKPPRVEWWFGGFLAFPDSMEAPYVREELEPLLESYDVDVVFNGHNHLYAHTPETPGGITWVTTGGGGGKLDERGFLDIWRVGRWPQIETTIHAFHFLVATMDGDDLYIEAIDRDGEVMHDFLVVGGD